MPPALTASERQAQGKFHCPACGGETTWDPSTKTLICAYCATPASEHPEALIQQDTIREHDLAEALERLPDSARGWSPKASSVRCQSCNAISVFEAEHAGKRCDFCGSSALVPYQELQQSIRPESLLPLRISEVEIRESIRKWYSKRWFAPSNLGQKALTDTIHGVYLPYWTFDAHAAAHWTALRATTTTRPSPTPTPTDVPKPAKSVTRAGSRAPALWHTFSMMNWCPDRRA